MLGSTATTTGMAAEKVSSGFFVTVENVAEGVGFAPFSLPHTAWLIATLLVCIVCGLWYRRATEPQRSLFRKVFACLLIADELFKIVCLLIMGQYLPKYLPLHLCSINIFTITWYAFVRQTETMRNFLYLICTAGALMALLFPSWSALPPTSFMYWHSSSVHLLLVSFPVILTIGGEIRPNPRCLPKVFALLVAFAVPALVANLIWGTNFMFLMYAEPGNPLYWFATHWGSHLWGFLVLVPALAAVMYAPWVIADAVRARRAKAADAEVKA